MSAFIKSYFENDDVSFSVYTKLYSHIIRHAISNSGSSNTVTDVGRLCSMRLKGYKIAYQRVTGQRDEPAAPRKENHHVQPPVEKEDTDDEDDEPIVGKVRDNSDDDSDDEGDIVVNVEPRAQLPPRPLPKIVVPHDDKKIYAVDDFWRAIDKCQWTDKNGGLPAFTVCKNAIAALGQYAQVIRQHFANILAKAVGQYQELGLQRAAKLDDDELEAFSSHVIAMGVDFYTTMGVDMDLMMYYATERIYIDFRQVVKRL